MKTKCPQGQPYARATVLVLTTILLTALLMVMALAIDGGHLYATKAHLQATADAAALAGAGGLGFSTDEAFRRAREYAQKNPVNGVSVTLQNEDIQLGIWNSTANTFTPTNPSSGARPQAVRILPRLASQRGNAVRLFFAGLMGHDTADVGASSTAVLGARDIMVVMDYSQSMCFDSTLLSDSIAELGASAVENNLRQIYQDLGSPQYGTKVMTFDGVTIAAGTRTNTILSTLGLSNATYPFPGAKDWNEYLAYVSGTSIDARYRYNYGYMTLMSYLQAKQYRATQTPDLWKTHEQPVASVKDGFNVFLDYIQAAPTDDRVGLVSFTYTDNQANNTARLETGLTNLLSDVKTTSQHLQAGHYTARTNTAAGLQVALDELNQHGRKGALKLIVLLSDGVPNVRLNGQLDSSPYTGSQKDALEQADLAAAAKIPIATISLGAVVDPTPIDPHTPASEGQLAYKLMNDIAAISKGVHFHVERGHSVEDYRRNLMDIFAGIARQPPLRLVE